MLYLDLAVDGAVRASVEASLSLMKAASRSEDEGAQAAQLLDLVTMCVESVCLTSGSNVEMVMLLKDYQVALKLVLTLLAVLGIKSSHMFAASQIQLTLIKLHKDL